MSPHLGRFGIGVVGCGYVVDDYLRTLPSHADLRLVGVTDLDAARAAHIAHRYRCHHFRSTKELLDCPDVDVVVNLTSPQSHHEVSRSALLHGKHVYTEKPLALRLDDARELVQLARRRGVLLSGAPCSFLGESWTTLRGLVRQGAVGRVRLVYAELDDNPIHLMHPEHWRSESGAPWPYQSEFETGCTLEHAPYHVAALAAMFGPARSVTAFSSTLLPHKSAVPLAETEAPDFSVAALAYESGVVARLTCSVLAPYDHRVRVIGDAGILTLEESWHNSSRLYLEAFNQLTLNARKLRAVRQSRVLQRLTGVTGRPQRVVPPQRGPGNVHEGPSGRPLWSSLRQQLRHRQLTSMDFLLGVEDLRRAAVNGSQPVITAEFLLHVTELTLAIAEGTPGTLRPSTTFELPRWNGTGGAPVRRPRSGPLVRSADRLMPVLHRR